ncbi:MAG: hypothetical protein HKN40_01045 [Winogradskyella sp.]|uniref:hypothetical protein n=1 Tax=Winogradskyella sp. TaxID=1883156 RepID=UPI001837A2AF|nr:hypothetical protein [Winogradskyella sp.]
MKSIFIAIIGLFLVLACKSNNSETPVIEEQKELNVAEKIANAHGYDNWKHVSEVHFTFQVDQDSIKGKGRTWTWFPRENRIKMNAGEQTAEYTRNKIDSTIIPADRAFINDKFWLLVPFQLVWDTAVKISEPKKANAPISDKEFNMITVVYPPEGGYTPGDAYDIYYSDDYLIREWVFRKSNSPDPTMATTFENYRDYNGIKIATDHKMANGNWNLNFTDISISSE